MSFTGIGGFIATLPEDHWNQRSKKIVYKNGTIFYGIGSDAHCCFGPAIIQANGKEEYFIEGIPLKSKDIKLFKEILENIKLAPLYVNHPVLKYTAKYVLRNFGSKNG